MKKSTKKKLRRVKKVAIGAGIVAVGALTGGANYVMGPKARGNQRKASALLNKIKKGIKKEVKKEVKKVKKWKKSSKR